MPTDSDLDLEELARSNPGVDARLLREARTLTVGLPAVPQGAQYTIRRAFADRRDDESLVVFRNSTSRSR